MSQQFDVSVVISTYNRCRLLPGALQSVLTQSAAGVSYEVIVVDNNSTDQTRRVVESFIELGHANLRYVFEGRQGLSHGRNAGIAHARAPIVAFTDDDIRASADWVALVARSFDAHPEVDFMGGKVAPRWNDSPPLWLTKEHWSPLALADHGEQSFYVDAERPICMVGANLSFRRQIFERVGLFAADLQRVKDGIGSTEDHEMLIRLWRAGRKGIYVPGLVVFADVQNERLTKAYHRRWHTGHGKYCSLMRFDEVPDSHGRETAEATLFGTPAYIYRHLMREAGRWLSSAASGREQSSFTHELECRYLAAYIRQRYRQNAVERKRSPVAEILRFPVQLWRKKFRSNSFRQLSREL